jgi:hypothetical protein
VSRDIARIRFRQETHIPIRPVWCHVTQRESGSGKRLVFLFHSLQGILVRICLVTLMRTQIPTFHVDTDTDPTLHKTILSLHASIVSVQGPAWLHFEAPQLLNFDLWCGSGSGSCFSLWIRSGSGFQKWYGSGFQKWRGFGSGFQKWCRSGIWIYCTRLPAAVTIYQYFTDEI